MLHMHGITGSICKKKMINKILFLHRVFRRHLFLLSPSLSIYLASSSILCSSFFHSSLLIFTLDQCLFSCSYTSCYCSKTRRNFSFRFCIKKEGNDGEKKKVSKRRKRRKEQAEEGERREEDLPHSSDHSKGRIRIISYFSFFIFSFIIIPYTCVTSFLFLSPFSFLLHSFNPSFLWRQKKWTMKGERENGRERERGREKNGKKGTDWECV